MKQDCPQTIQLNSHNFRPSNLLGRKLEILEENDTQRLYKCMQLCLVLVLS